MAESLMAGWWWKGPPISEMAIGLWNKGFLPSFARACHHLRGLAISEMAPGMRKFHYGLVSVSDGKSRWNYGYAFWYVFKTVLIWQWILSTDFLYDFQKTSDVRFDVQAAEQQAQTVLWIRRLAGEHFLIFAFLTLIFNFQILQVDIFNLLQVKCFHKYVVFQREEFHIWEDEESYPVEAGLRWSFSSVVAVVFIQFHIGLLLLGPVHLLMHFSTGQYF